MPIFCCYVIALKLNIWLKLKLVWEHLSIFTLQSVFGAIRIQLQFLVDFILACNEQLSESGIKKMETSSNQKQQFSCLFSSE